MKTAALAIVGMACEYPDARTPTELFENSLAGRRAFRRIPDQRLPLSEYGSDDPDAVDATTVRQAAVIEGWSFDRVRFRTVGSTYRSADLTHWLALDVADRALRDAGFPDGEGLPRERVGVVIGNTLTGEFTRAQALRLRWPYVRRVLEQTLREQVEEPVGKAIVAEMERRYKAPFEPFGDESLAGGLSNTIAGRICNYFDLHGGGFTVDGACASSLLAVANACNSLLTGDLDVALAGGVDLSLDPFELVGFARAGALARDEMRVYDQRAQGFWPGEGCGVVVLMREADARAQGRPIHARIRGWGIASDGAGGISRPEESGQLLALRRAYVRAGIDASDVGYFEGHGTGTAVGDATELAALTRLLEEYGAPPERPTPIASIKSGIGHTKAAAGIAGLIHATCALRHGVVPSLPGCDRPDPHVDPSRGGRLRVLARAEPWPGDRPRCAGVSSMGFGGINTHVVLDVPGSARRARELSRRHVALVGSAQDCELFLLAAPDPSALRVRLEALARSAAQMSRAELGDCAAALAASCSAPLAPAGVRAAIAAATPDELVVAARRIAAWLAGGAATRIDAEHGCFLGAGSAGRIGFLFPGQAAPVRGELGAVGAALCGLGLAAIVERQREATAGLGSQPTPGGVDTRAAQPAIIASSLAALRLLEAFGIAANVAVGHSVGEIAALAWADALSDEAAVALAAARGRIVSERAVAGGAMASLTTSAAHAERLAKTHGCCLAAVNGPRRCVVAGEVSAIERLVESARAQQITAARLPVSHAFHSPAIAPCAPALAEHLAALEFTAPRSGVISTRTGAALGAGPDLREHLVAQLTEPVRFADAVEVAREHADLFLEVGPGQMLATLAGEFVGVPTLSIDVEGGSWRGLLCGVGAAFALGAALRRDALFAGRILKPFDPERVPQFFASPCGLGTESPSDVASAAHPLPPRAEDRERSPLQVVRELVAARCELPVESVGAGDRFLSDLHLTSIAVSELASRAARVLGRPPLVAPNEFADATVGQLALAIESEERGPGGLGVVAGVDAWVAPFAVAWVERPVPRASSRGKRGPGRWQAFAPAASPVVERLVPLLEREIGGDGVLVHLPSGAGREGLRELLQAAKAAFGALELRGFVLLHHGDPAVAIARCLHQEARALSTRVIEVPDGDPELERHVLDEVRGGAAYLECRYDTLGRRFERRLERLSQPDDEEAGSLPLGADDVLLVTGGGKGIAAECAAWLARRSGCALALLGRSRPEHDAALQSGLDRLAAEGIRFRYASADVCDREATLRAVDGLEAGLGPITALLHGAGVNEPRSLSALELEHVEQALAPKTAGLRTLLARLEAQLRCVIGFGSVVAEVGLPGEAHYAYANEQLSREIECFAATHPAVRCLSVEWSVWSGVGMGDRLGRVEILAAKNISPISPEVGCAWLARLLARSDLPVRVFLSGRFGNPATLEVLERPLPVRRFVEHVREYTPGVELVVDVELAPETDPWVRDHVYRGEALVPAVLGLEALAQVAIALHGAQRAPLFDDVRFLLPVIVPADGKCTVRIAALDRGRGSVELAMRSAATGFAADHMRAIARFDRKPDVEAPSAAALTASAPPELDPARDLYGSLLFQTGRFRRVRGYDALHWNGCSARIEARDETWFGGFQPETLDLGDPGARDAAIHAIQACLPHCEVLPMGVERIDLLRPVTGGEVRLLARERGRAELSYLYDFWLTDAEGTLLEAWHGLTLRAVAGATPPQAWPPALLAPRIEEIANTALPGLALRAAVVIGDGRPASERAFAIAHGEWSPLRHRGDGKPLLEAAPFASASHAHGLTLAIVAAAPVACDLEIATGRSASDWAELLGPDRFAVATGLADLLREPLDHAATRVWGVAESLRKVGAARETPILFESSSDDTVRLAAGRFAAFCWRGTLRGTAAPWIATVLGGTDDAQL